MTSTPTASSERMRLWAPVMPVAGSGAAVATEVAVVSTPVREAAASRVAASREAPRAACSLGVVVISAFSWTLRLWRGGKRGGIGGQKKPPAPGPEGEGGGGGPPAGRRQGG